MPRKRDPINAGLPQRWRFEHGTYFYQVPPGLEMFWDGKKKFNLGKNLNEAHKLWASRLKGTHRSDTIRDLLERYLIEVVPTKQPATSADNVLSIKQLTGVFGAMPINSMKPQFVYRYIDQRRQKKVSETGKVTGGLAAARKEIKVLSHAFTKAVEWGYIDRHPFLKELRIEAPPPRDRYVEDWEIVECLKLDSKRKKGSIAAIQAYIRIKLMTGMARSDLLRLTMSDIKPDGIYIQRHKTRESSGKRTVYEMTPDLQTAIDMAKAARPRLSALLFCNSKAMPYINESTGMAHGWDSMWQRFFARVLKETNVKTKFTEHDLRAKCASDAASLDQARALLSHADSRTTSTIYRRKPERVQPLQGMK